MVSANWRRGESLLPAELCQGASAAVGLGVARYCKPWRGRTQYTSARLHVCTQAASCRHADVPTCDVSLIDVPTCIIAPPDGLQPNEPPTTRLPDPGPGDVTA